MCVCLCVCVCVCVFVCVVRMTITSILIFLRFKVARLPYITAILHRPVSLLIRSDEPDDDAMTMATTSGGGVSMGSNIDVLAAANKEIRELLEKSNRKCSELEQVCCMLYICVCVCVCVYVCLYVCKLAHTLFPLNSVTACIHTYSHVHTCIHYMHIYAYAHAFI